MLQLTFLGTSSGMPTKFRNVSGMAIECLNPYLSADRLKSKNNRPWVMIDCGEGTQHQILHTKLSLHQLAAICITHVHGDHCYGLPGLLSSMAMSGRQSPLTLIAPKAIATFLDTLTITTHLSFPFQIEFLAIEDFLKAHLPSSEQTINIPLSMNHKLTIDITKLSHRVDSYAFSLTQTIERTVLDKEKLNKQKIAPGPIWGQLKRGHDVNLDNGTRLHSTDFVQTDTEVIKIVISGDNDDPTLLANAIKGASLLVHESTYTQTVADKIHARKDGINPQHSTAKQVAKFCQAYQIPNLVLTHFSARYQPFDDPTDKVDNMGHIREEIETHCCHYKRKYLQHFWMAEDFSTFIINQNKVSKIS